MPLNRRVVLAAVGLLFSAMAWGSTTQNAADALGQNPANAFTYLDESDPFYVSQSFPKLTTPQWVGDPGVDAGWNCRTVKLGAVYLGNGYAPLVRGVLKAYLRWERLRWSYYDWMGGCVKGL